MSRRTGSGAQARRLAAPLAICAAILASACDLPYFPTIDDINPFDPDYIHVDEIKLTSPMAYVAVGASGNIGFTLSPNNAFEQRVSWSSSDEAIATVDPQGQVTGVKAGEVVIKATTRDGAKTADCDLVVVEHWVDVAGFEVLSAQGGYETTLVVGDTDRLSASITPADASDRRIAWNSVDPSIATVDENGRVTAISPGMTSVNCLLLGRSWTQGRSVIVKSPEEAVPVGVAVVDSSLVLSLGESYALAASVQPRWALDKRVAWSSLSEDIASVDASGIVTAKAAGSAKIVATTVVGGYKAECSVYVDASPFMRASPTGLSQTRGLSLSADGNIIAATGTASTGGSNGRLSVSTDRGRSWSLKPSYAYGFQGPIDMSRDGALLAAIVYGSGASERQVVSSRDMGETWTGHETAGTRAWSAIAVSADGSTIAACVNGGSVFVSHDAGTTWKELRAAVSQNWSCIDVSADGGIVVAGSQGNGMDNTDGGLVWKYVRADDSFTGLAKPSAEVWRSIALSSDGSTIGAQAGMAFISRDGGGSWSTKFTDRATLRMSSDARVLFIGSVYSWVKLLYSLDGGLSWTETPRKSAPAAMAVSDDGNILAHADGSWVFLYDRSAVK